MEKYADVVLSAARDFAAKDICEFSELENKAIRPFFTNSTKRVFFMHSLPTAVGVVLLAMYSRLKNKRGIRGVFVDQFLPQFLSTELAEVGNEFGGDPDKFLKARDIKSLEQFVSYSAKVKFSFERGEFEKFLDGLEVDPKYVEKFSASRKVKKFLGVWLDKYGHNSIARGGSVWLCSEQISILCAKSLEWGRPGSGYIELSTRYVDMSGKGCYPIENELEVFGLDPRLVTAEVERSFEMYKHFEGDNFSGPFPQYLKENYSSLYAGAEKDLEAGVIGETCDVLGNFLPAATLTSVGCSVSGEALPELVKHLLLDNTPENIAIAEMIVEEGKKIGLDQFLRHYEPTPWKIGSWQYLDELGFSGSRVIDSADWLYPGSVLGNRMPSRSYTEDTLLWCFKHQPDFRGVKTFEEVIEMLKKLPRGEFDKLPNHFESVSAVFEGIMSFRGWRDLHRQSFSMHMRTYLTPKIGFYEYNKNAPEEFFDVCRELHVRNLDLYNRLRALNVPRALVQYPMVLGNLVGFLFGGNLLQLEFCNWQRTKYSVNHEVRQIFLKMEWALRREYPWWKEISRADLTPAYVFARGNKAIPLGVEIFGLR